MAVYTVTHDSPVRYHIQGADDGLPVEIDDDLVRKYKAEKMVSELFSDWRYGFELEVRFANIFQKELPYLIQKLSATRAEFDPIHHKITCEFVPKDTVYFSLNHQARYSRVTLFLKTADEKRIPLETVTCYLSSSADPKYNISSQTLHFRAQIKEIDETMKKSLEGNMTQNPVRRKLDFGGAEDTVYPLHPLPKMFPDPGESQILDSYFINGQMKLGVICQLIQAKFELTTFSD